MGRRQALEARRRRAERRLLRVDLVRRRDRGGEGGGHQGDPRLLGRRPRRQADRPMGEAVQGPRRVRLHLPRERARRPQQAEPRVGEEDARVPRVARRVSEHETRARCAVKV
jgi:hypothetical protein